MCFPSLPVAQLDEQLSRLQREKNDLQSRMEEDQEDMNELMKKHKAAVAQVTPRRRRSKALTVYHKSSPHQRQRFWPQKVHNSFNYLFMFILIQSETMWDTTSNVDINILLSSACGSGVALWFGGHTLL